MHRDKNERSIRTICHNTSFTGWDRFDGRWLRGEEFIYPDRPKGLPKLREPIDVDRFGIWPVR